jgi:hypothetical protein
LEQPVKSVNDFAEGFQKDLAVAIIVEDVLPRIAARGRVVQRAVKFDSEKRKSPTIPRSPP